MSSFLYFPFLLVPITYVLWPFLLTFIDLLFLLSSLHLILSYINWKGDLPLIRLLSGRDGYSANKIVLYKPIFPLNKYHSPANVSFLWPWTLKCVICWFVSFRNALKALKAVDRPNALNPQCMKHKVQKLIVTPARSLLLLVKTLPASQ